MKNQPFAARKRLVCWGGAALALLAISSPALPKYLIWNASSSMPKGLYLVLPEHNIRRGQIVAIMPPPTLGQWMNDRQYLPLGMPLLKPVVATKGHQVCRIGGLVSVHGEAIALAKNSDSHGRALPVWQGCVWVKDGELFALSTHSPDSLDGRYFGTLPTSSLQGRAFPIWTEEAK